MSRQKNVKYLAEGLRRMKIRKEKRKEQRRYNKSCKLSIMCEMNPNKVCNGCMDC